MIVYPKKYSNLDITVIHHFYTPEELEEVRDEIKELMAHKRPATATGVALDDKTKKPLKTGKGLWLDRHYGAGRDASSILKYNRKLFSEELLDGLIEKSVHYRAIKNSSKDTTLLNFYEDKEEYKEHTDNSLYTAIIVLKIGDTKKGELYFKDIDEKFELIDNSAIIFPGCALHHAMPVECEPGNYRISIATFINYNKED